MSDVFENKGTMAATVVVAASDSLNKTAANYVCDGTDDHLEIQAALDALPDTGGEVFLLDGTYNIEVALVLGSYQTLRGCGRNTILTTTTAGLDIITATGTSGNEKVGILITDLCIDGTAGGTSTDVAIIFDYVDHSKIIGVWLLNSNLSDIRISNCDFNEFTNNHYEGGGNGIYASAVSNSNIMADNVFDSVSYPFWLKASNYNTMSGNVLKGAGSPAIDIDGGGHNIISGNIIQGGSGHGIHLHGASTDNVISGNTCQGNATDGIFLDSSNNNTVSGNTCQGNTRYGISLDASLNNVISDNICEGNSDYGIDLVNGSKGNIIADNICKANDTDGIELEANSDHNIIKDNICWANGENGMWLSGSNNTISGNICVANSQNNDNIFSNLFIYKDHNLITGNLCRMGDLANQPKYGIYISGTKNLVQGNDLHDAGKTANFNDAGTLTIVEDDNREIEITQVKRYVYMKNTSLAQRVAGDVVVFKTGIAAGNEFTTTTTLGDDHALGIVAETIANDAYGYVLVAGKTVVLSGSNDNGNIVVGDFLCCSDTATEAVLATAGTTAFAIALEALAASGPEPLDALLINPLTF